MYYLAEIHVFIYR